MIIGIKKIICSWQREGNLTAKFYYGMKRLVWEFLNGPLKSKMEVCWSDITAIEAVMIPNQPGFLRVQVSFSAYIIFIRLEYD